MNESCGSLWLKTLTYSTYGFNFNIMFENRKTTNPNYNQNQLPIILLP